MTTLLLLRHAKAEPLQTSDHSRTLTLQGREQATHIAQLLQEQGLIPQVVLCSDSVRTRQTWQVISAQLGLTDVENGPRVFYHSDLYEGGINDVVGYSASVAPETDVVLVVGHEPVISGTAARLASPESDPALISRVRVGVPTATVCVLHLDSIEDLQGEELGRHQARLDQIITAPEHVD